MPIIRCQTPGNPRQTRGDHRRPPRNDRGTLRNDCQTLLKNYYLPDGDGPKRSFLEHFAARLPANATPAGVTPAEVASVSADSAYFDFVLNQQAQYKGAALEWTSYKNALRDGPLGSPATAPAALTPPATPPPAVAPSIFVRIAQLVQRIKNTTTYTEAIGADLGIEGVEQAGKSTLTTSAKPQISAAMIAGHPTIKWTKGKMDALEIQVDRSDTKGFVFLAIDSQPDYPDTTPLPTACVTAIWKYRAIYRKSDEKVGQWSDVLEVTVTGL